MISLTDALASAELFEPHYSGPSWDLWRAVLKATFAEEMTKTERKLFRSVADRDPPKEPASELWCIVGRSGGKDSIAALVATYIAAFRDFGRRLRAGEKAIVACVAVDRSQARIAIDYIAGLFDAIPALGALLTRRTDEAFELAIGSTIEIHTNSYRATRGRSFICAIFDEAAFWRDENFSSPDSEVYTAVAPGLARMPGSILIGISSPYKRSGLLFEKWRDHYGQDGDIVVVKGPSLLFNPSLDRRIVERAYERDPVAAASEYGAEWRAGISGFLDTAWIDRAATLEAGELPPVSGVEYRCFIDPSGGRADAMTVGISHREESGRTVVDLVRGRKAPFEPQSVVAEFAETAKRYRISRATADRYGGSWVTEAFANFGIKLEASELSASEIYLEAEPLFAQGSIAIPADRTLLHELRNLERRTHRGGRDSVDHPVGLHDDFSVACCGAAILARAPTGLETWRAIGRKPGNPLLRVAGIGY